MISSAQVAIFCFQLAEVAKPNQFRNTKRFLTPFI